MKKLQKLTALLLSFLLLACVMAGCGKTDDSDFPSIPPLAIPRQIARMKSTSRPMKPIKIPPAHAP